MAKKNKNSNKVETVKDSLAGDLESLEAKIESIHRRLTSRRPWTQTNTGTTTSNDDNQTQTTSTGTNHGAGIGTGTKAGGEPTATSAPKSKVLAKLETFEKNHKWAAILTKPLRRTVERIFISNNS